MKLKDYIIFGLVIALFLSVHTCRNKSSDARQNLNLVESLNDTLVNYKNDKGENEAKISVITTTNRDLFKEINSKDSTINELQEIVDKKTQTAAIIKTETKTEDKQPTEVIIEQDSIYPTYKSKIDKDGWIYGDIIADKDSTYTNLTVKNEYSLSIKRDNKRSNPYAIITNKNPYTETKEMRVYDLDIPRPSRFGLGLSAGMSINSRGAFFPYVGVGLNYNLFNF